MRWSAWKVSFRFGLFAAKMEVALGFKRSGLGFLWSSLSLAFFIALVGTLYAAILKDEHEPYSRFITAMAAGMVIWSFAFSSINRSASCVGHWAPLLRHAPIPVAAMPTIHFLQGGLAFVVNSVFGLALYFGLIGDAGLLVVSSVAGIAIFSVFVWSASQLAFLASLRYRSFPQVCTGFMQCAFLMTPILWPEYILGKYRYLNDLNPFYHLLTLVRAPLLGQAPSELNWCVGMALTALSLATAIWLIVRKSETTPYWL